MGNETSVPESHGSSQTWESGHEWDPSRFQPQEQDYKIQGSAPQPEVVKNYELPTGLGLPKDSSPKDSIPVVDDYIGFDEYLNTDETKYAIVGYHIRLPGACTAGENTIEEFYDVLYNKKRIHSDLTKEGSNEEDGSIKGRFELRNIDLVGWQNPLQFATRYANVLAGGSFFDASFFGIGPREAGLIDTDQRMLMNTAWYALEHAGLDPLSLRGKKVAVVIGSQVTSSCTFGTDYGHNEYSLTGGSNAILANRISAFYGFEGASFVVNTACSSTLYAFDLAHKLLRSGSAEMALVGGTNTLFSAHIFARFAQLGVISKSGYCNSFADNADGYLRSEGNGVFVLMSLRKAVQSGRKIRAVVRETHSNCASPDQINGLAFGRPLTAPTTTGQYHLMTFGYKKAGLEMKDIDFIEAHATGTLVGDGVEMTAISSTIGQREDNPLIVGGVKSNVGHLEGGSGVPALAKVLIMMEHRTFLPTAIEHPAPIIEQQTSVELLLEPRPFPDKKVIIGINSFGIGGSNSLVILEEFRPPFPIAKLYSQPIATNPNKAYLFPISARSQYGLNGLIEKYAQLLEKHPETDFYRLAGNMSVNRGHYFLRSSFVSNSREDLISQLSKWSQKKKFTQLPESKPPKSRIGFIFSGQGGQWLGCGAQLYATEPVFKAVVDEMHDIYVTFSGGWSPREPLLNENSSCRVDDVTVAQPMLFFYQVGIFHMLLSWGIKPSVVLGHSAGELGAVLASGAIPLADMLKITHIRAHLQASQSGKGRLLAVGISQQVAEDEYVNPSGGKINIAAVNSHLSVTLVGEEAKLQTVLEACEAKGIFARFVVGTIPFHSPAMEGLREKSLSEFAAPCASLREVQHQIVSTVTGDFHTTFNAAYWFSNIRQPVSFQRALLKSLSHADVFVELSPHGVLTASVQDVVGAQGTSHECYSSGVRNKNDAISFHECIGKLYDAGVPLAWNNIFPRPEPLDTLPHHPFDAKNVINHTQEPELLVVWGPYHDGPIIGKRTWSDQKMFTTCVSTRHYPYLEDHVVQRTIIAPGGYYLEGILEAATAMELKWPIRLRNMKLAKPLILKPKRKEMQQEKPHHIQFQIGHPGLDGVREFKVVSTENKFEDEIILHSSGTLETGVSGFTPIGFPEYNPPPVLPAGEDAMIKEFREPRTQKYDLYDRIHPNKYFYGPSLRVIEWMRYDPSTNRYLAKIIMDEDIFKKCQQMGYLYTPILLDGIMQVFLIMESMNDDYNSVPSEIEQFIFYRPPPSNVVYCVYHAPSAPNRHDPVLGMLNNGSVDVYTESGDLIASQRHYWCFLSKSDAVTTDIGFGVVQQNKVLPLVAPSAPVPRVEEVPSKLLELAAEQTKVVLKALSDRSAASESDEDKFAQSEFVTKILPSLFTSVKAGAIPDDVRNSTAGALVTGVAQRMAESLKAHGDYNDHGAWSDAQSAIDPLRGSLVHTINQVTSWIEKSVSKSIGVRARVTRIAEVGNVPFGRLLLSHSANNAILNNRNVQWTVLSNNNGLLKQAERTKTEVRPIPVSSWDNFQPPELLEGLYDFAIVHGTGFIPGSDASARKSTLSKLIKSLTTILSPGGVLILEGITSAPEWLKFIAGSQFQTINNLTVDLDTWTSALDDTPSFLEPAIDVKLEGSLFYAIQKKRTLEPSPLKHDAQERRALLFADSNGFAKKFAKLCVDDDRFPISTVVVQETDLVEEDNEDVPVPDFPRSIGKSTLVPNCPASGPALRKLLATYGDVTDIVVFAPISDNSNFAMESWLTIVALCKALIHGRDEDTEGSSKYVKDKLLWIITQGASLDTPRPHLSCLHGLMRSAGQELMAVGTTVKIIDIGSIGDLPQLHKVILQPSGDHEINIRGQNVFVPRLVVLDESSSAQKESKSTLEYYYRLNCTGSQDIAQMEWIFYPPPQLPDWAVDINVKAAALNLRDLMVAMGMLDKSSFNYSALGRCVGIECSGHVTRIGKDVKDFKGGEAVIATGPATIASVAQIPEPMVVVKPKNISFEEGAGIPSVYITALYALEHLARLAEGESVLIHSALGGVGQAAMSIAFAVGATVYATAGTEEKRQLLRDMGCEEVFDSRSLSWADALMKATNGKGVDVVLNSLAGEHITKGLSVLKPSGRYCEIGKRDIYDNSKIGMMALRKNISFFIIDIDQLSLNSPMVVAKFLNKVVENITTGRFKSPQVTNFKFINYLDAFRLMQKGTHTGKLILVRDDESDKAICKKAPKSFTLFQSDKKYFIAGGFGGVGPYMIKFMADLGAKKFILADRDQQRRRTAKNIREYVRLDADVEIEVVQGDVAIKADVDRMIAGSTPLGAIVQLAGVLQDASIVNESRIRYQTTLNPKAQAALFLHEASKELPVEHFIMFSSVASTFGSAGQGSYSSANAFLDALTRHRLAMGLPATVYNMGPICDAGMALRDSFARKHFHMTGVAAMRTTVALGVLETALRHRLCQVVSMQFIKGDNQPMGNNVLLMEHVMPAMKEQAAGGTESFADVLAEVIAQIGEVAGVENIDADRGLSTYGIDSFMGTDLSGWLKRRYGVNISQLEIVIKFSAKTLAEAVVAQKSGVAVTESDDHEEEEETTTKEGDDKTVVNSEYSPALEAHFPGTKFGDVILQGEDHRVRALSAKTKVKVDAPVSLADVAKYWTELNKADPSNFPYATLKAKYVDMVKKYISVTYKSKAVARHFRPVLASDKTSDEIVGLPNKEIAYPLTDVKSEGSYIWDVDGNKLIDTVAGHGSVFYGHKAEFIEDAIEKRVKYGYNVATQSEFAGEVAQLIVDLTGAQRVSFTQTGTEAVLQAVRVARSYTKKPKVVVFEGHYHGNDDTFLQRPWAQLDMSFPAAEGVAFNDNVLALPFSLAAIPKIRKNKDSIAAIVLEPVPSLSSRVDASLLHALRAVATECGIVLIFDEVYTGFRCNVGGAQSYFGVRADLVTYGLVLGGGLPLGVLAGSEPLLKVIDGGVWQYGDQSLPVNRTASSGTFAGHPLALAAARAILWKFKEAPNQDQVSLNVRVRHLFDDLKAFFVGKPVPFALNGFGSTLSFNAAQADLQWVRLFEQLLVLKGVYMSRHRMIFTVAHNDRDYAYVSKAIKSTYKELFDPNLNVSIDIPNYLARDSKPGLGEDYITAHNINVAFNEVSDAQWAVKGEEELFQAYDQINALQTGNIAAVPSESWSSIFVTGATGFVGRFVLDQILKTTKVKVYALVRAANETLAQKRLQFALKEAKLTSEYPASRLVVVNGDLEKDNFGLSQSVYDELLNNIDAVFHLGANTAQKPYNEVKVSNVQGTQRVIKFSVTNKLKWLVYFSSLSIFPAYSANFAGSHALRSSINEDQKPKASEIPVADGYSKSKLVAEKLVEKARTRHGLPVIVLRPGSVWADSKNGFTTGKDFFTKFLRTAVHVKAIPDNDQIREISPVDVIADVSVKTALRRATSNTTIADQHVFHLLSSEGRTNGQIARMLQNLGFPKVKLVTPSEFVNAVASSSGTPLTSANLSGLTKDTKVTSFGERILAYSYLDDPISIPVSVHNVEGNWPSSAHVLNSGLKYLKSQGLLGR